MELKEFVINAIIELDQAIDKINEDTSRKVRFSTTKEKRTVEFDIAVTVEVKNVKNGEASIKVLQLVAGGGNLSKENLNAKVSRIQFGIDIDPYTKKENENFPAPLVGSDEQSKYDVL
jgi:hypothetical protein